MRKHKCQKAVGRRSRVALLRCNKPARHAIRKKSGKALAWVCRKHWGEWRKHIDRLLAD